MGLTFYPIECDTTLQEFRQRLCPFMKAIQKAIKIYDSSSYCERESIFDEIISAARSNQINNQLSRQWFNYIRAPFNRTLNDEHDNLIAINLE